MTQPDNSAYTSIPAQYGRLVSASLPCPSISLADFLQHGRGSQRFYWESSRDNVAFAGVGTALELMAWGPDRYSTIQNRAMELFADSVVLSGEEPLAAPRLFGGFSFRDDFMPDIAWSDFTPAHFVLPHYQLVRVGDAMWLTLNAHIPYGENPRGMQDDLTQALQAKIDELRAYEPSPLPTMTTTDTAYPMPYETWETHINAAKARMQTGDLKKVVLSRVAEIRFDTHVVVDTALQYLSQAYPDTYRFLFEPRPYHAFYGATPELLVGVNGKRATTMALAGSIGRGADADADAALAQELLDSDKDRYEHQLVIDGILTRLDAYAERLEVGETDIMTLSNIQHIHTPIQAKLQSDMGIVPLVEALHPTPALGGDPQDLAMQLIGEYESVPRGWYAAPVGWIDRDLNGQFSVAIRSAVAQDKRVWLYAGAGIVKDSQPRNEWDETALKFKPMLEALAISAEY